MAGFQDFAKIPDLSGGATAESLKKVQDYLFLLQEQLTFLFQNIGVENLNEQAVSEMKTLFTQEIEGRIADDEERLSEFQLTAEHLNLSFQDADRRISELKQDAEHLDLSFRDADQQISELKQNAEHLDLSFRDADQRISQLKQSVDGISLSVADGNGVVSSVDLSSGTLDLKNLVFSVLKENGATIINGGNIRTGTISAVDIQGVRITGSEITGSALTSVSDICQVEIDGGRLAFYNENGRLLCGSLSYDGMGRLVLSSLNDAVLRVESSSNLSINARSGKTIYIGSDIGTVQRVDIGNSDSIISLCGTVKINGTVIS